MKDLSTDGLSPTREFKIFTGVAGKSAFDNAMLIANAKDMLSWMVHTAKIITEEENNNLIEMLDSVDRENMHLAINIIEIKREQHVRTKI